MRLFERSDYRYLHLSCHGADNSIDTTLELISFNELARIINPHLDNKRLFISACSVVKVELAEKIIPFSDCLSIIGPANDIYFHDAAIVWASFYHLMFKEDAGKMVRRDITATLQKVAMTFKIPLNYFSVSENHGFKGDLITTRGRIKRIYPLPE